MELLLIRYSEIGLKSTPIRRRFESQLKDNIMSMLARDNVEAMVSNGDARFFVEASDLDTASDAIRRVFGVASLSRATVVGSSMEEICAAAAEYSKGKVKKGQSFAVRARREGNHDYTSMDLGREAGSAIFLANDDLKVDLTNPEITFYIEVRNNKAYIFSEYIPGPGGLPLGSQGKVAAQVDNDRGILSAWLMMKRGCRALVYGKADMSLLSRYDPSLKIMTEDILDNILGKVLGTSLDELDDVEPSDIPLFFPTIGMNDSQVRSMLDSIY